MPISDIVDTCVGVSVFLSSMAFEAEVGRRSAIAAMATMDEEFENYDIEDDAEVRVSEIMMSVQETVLLMHQGSLEPEDAVTEIAYAFVYGFLKQQQTASLDGIRGIVCVMMDEMVNFHHYETDDEYQAAIAHAREGLSAYEHQMKSVDLYAGKKPTIH